MQQKNKILFIHAEWLLKNGYYADSIDCFKQAEDYNQNKDLRQTNGFYCERRRNERAVI